MNNFIEAVKRNAAVLGVMGLGVLAVGSAIFLSRSTSTVSTGAKAATNVCSATYTILATTVAPTPVPCYGSMDINLVMDRSSSMNTVYNGKTKLQWEKDAMIEFLKAAHEKVLSDDNLTVRVAVTSYGAQGNKNGVTDPTEANLKLGEAYKSQLLTGLQNLRTQSAYDAVVAAVNGVVYNPSGDGTCTECGIRIGRQQVFNATDRSLVKANILIADGLSNRVWDGTGYLEPAWKDENPQNPANLKAVCEAARGKGVSISGCDVLPVTLPLDYYVVGYGSGNGINPTTLKDISSTGRDPYYFENPIPSDWAVSMEKVLANLCEVSSDRAGR